MFNRGSADFENVAIKKADVKGLGGILASLSTMYGRENRGTSDIDSIIYVVIRKKLLKFSTTPMNSQKKMSAIQTLFLEVYLFRDVLDTPLLEMCVIAICPVEPIP